MPKVTNAQAVRRDLLVSRSTADSIAGRLDLPTDVVTAILKEDEIAGLVESRPLEHLHVWQLTTDHERFVAKATELKLRSLDQLSHLVGY